MALDELKGLVLDPVEVQIERGPVRAFARSLTDGNPVYDAPDAPVPPTFPFVFPFWGSAGVGGGAGLPMDRLRARGLVLHGDQAFEYHSWPRVGDTLVGTSVISDVYEKERSDGSRMEFYVRTTTWIDKATGERVVDDTFTLIVMVTATAS